MELQSKTNASRHKLLQNRTIGRKLPQNRGMARSSLFPSSMTTEWQAINEVRPLLVLLVVAWLRQAILERELPIY
jgi:hypothetical protein